MKKKNRAIKFDEGKVRLSLLPREGLIAEARALEYGLLKYPKHNYKNGMRWTRCVDACLRHLTAFANGEDNDPESGLSHLAHAKLCLGMLICLIELGTGEDDRLS